MTDSDNIALKLDSISKSFIINDKEIHALKKVSFEVRRGETMGIIGPNGAGKSTLLRILSKVTKPSSGIAWHEGSITSIIEIGTGFHSDLTGKENVFLNAAMLGISKEEVKEIYPLIVEFSGLEEYMDIPVKKYSSGMYLRLAFSLAFHSKIDVLLLDEVIAVGDSEFKRKCYSKITELKENGSAIVLVSHHMEAVLQFCDRCIYLNSGEILAIGQPNIVVEQYLINSNDIVSGKINSTLEQEIEKPKRESFKLLNLPKDPIGTIVIKNIELIYEAKKPLSTEHDFQLKITVEKIIEKDSFEIGIYLQNLNGLRLLIDSYSMRPEYSVRDLEKGIYELVCTIKGNLFSAGVYQLGLFVCRNMKVEKEIENVASIRLENPSYDNLFGRTMGSIIRPKFDWSLRRIDKADL